MSVPPTLTATTISENTIMSAYQVPPETEMTLPPPIPQAPKPPKKLKPARKQVKPGDVEKTEAVQTGKEYSAFGLVRDIYKAIKGLILCVIIDIWYNKWAGGDREDSYSKYVHRMVVALHSVLTCYCI